MSGPVNFDGVMHANATAFGTGAIPLGAAIPGYRAMPAAADGQLVTITVYECDASGVRNGRWETFVGVYTHAGTSVARGTFRASSTGALVDFNTTAAKRVIVGPLAGALMSTATGTDAAATLVANTELELDTSILSADRILTLPTTAAIGDVIEVASSGNNASFEAILKTGAGETCEYRGAQIAAASEITRMFIDGEWIRFKKISATKWRAREQLIPIQVVMRLSTSTAATESSSTFTTPTAISGVWTADINVGGCASVSNSRIISRRAGNFRYTVSAFPLTQMADGNTIGAQGKKNGTTGNMVYGNSFQAAATLGTSVNASATIAMTVVDDYMEYQFSTSQGTRGLQGFATVGQCPSAFQATEVL